MSALFCMRFAVVSFSVLFILLDDSDKWQHSAASCWIKGKNNMIKPRDHHQNEHIQLDLESIDQSSRQIERVLTGFNGNWSIRVATGHFI